MSKVLITGFEPFGFIRKSIQNKNASKDVIDLIRNQTGHEAFFEILSVDQTGEETLQKILNNQRPAGRRDLPW
jgi:pyrrolidone-carboxylate peptidase